MSKPQIVKCADGHYCRAIYGFGPYIADYPEQVLLTCIVQGWCPKQVTSNQLNNLILLLLLFRCTACRTDLDNDPNSISRNHKYTQILMDAFASHVLWKKYGIVDDILVKFSVLI